MIQSNGPHILTDTLPLPQNGDSPSRSGHPHMLGVALHIFISGRSGLWVIVVEGDRHTGLSDSTLTLLVNQLLQAGSTDLDG
jgi:hypothetical protein